MIAVADTYDAVTSDRSYRPRKTHEEAIAILREIAGTQLDPHLVEIFLRVSDGTAKTGAGNLFEEPKGMDGK